MKIGRRVESSQKTVLFKRGVLVEAFKRDSND
jgi:hypothetical protein